MNYTRQTDASNMLACSKCGTAILTKGEIITALSTTPIFIACPKGGEHTFKKYHPLTRFSTSQM